MQNTPQLPHGWVARVLLPENREPAECVFEVWWIILYAQFEIHPKVTRKSSTLALNNYISIDSYVSSLAVDLLVLY